MVLVYMVEPDSGKHGVQRGVVNVKSTKTDSMMTHAAMGQRI